MPGYSPTPLVKKIGIKDGYNCRLINPFDRLKSLLKPLPNKAKFGEDCEEVDLIIWCCNVRPDLEKNLPNFMHYIHKNGVNWVCWYKKASKRQLDVNEDVIRNTALALGLVDVKVCAVDEEWSALKFVYRLENR